MLASDLNMILPEIVLALFALSTLIGAVWTGKDALTTPISWATAALFLFLAVMLATSNVADKPGFGGIIRDDYFARFAEILVLVAAGATLVMSLPYLQKRDLMRFEYPVLVVLSVLGMMVMISAGDLMTLYMGLELQSLALYVLASLRRDSARSTEAGLKYFVLGALSSGLLLYGASLTYGFAGTTQFDGIFVVANEGISLGLLLGLTLMICGLAFKISAVPFHMWTPDVYEGAPTAITAFLASAPKVAAMALLARLLMDGFGSIIGDWQQILALLAIASMFLGSIAAIGQTDLKRLMAYSSIAHMGYALVGLAAGTPQGIEAMLIYMSIYIIMNIGTFALILSLSQDGQPITEISRLNMYSKTQPAAAIALLILMFSLAGVPPALGFFGKFAVLQAAVDAGLVWLAVAAVIASVIGAYYYLRIVYIMFFGEEGEALDRVQSPVLRGALYGSVALLLIGLVSWFGIDNAAAIAAASLLGE